MRRFAWILLLAACHASPRPAPRATYASSPPAPAATFAGRGEVTPAVAVAHLRDGSWPVADLVDPARGLVHDWTETGDVDEAAPDIHAHLCGDALPGALAELATSIPAVLRASAADDATRCDAHECTIGIANEYAPARVMLFDARAGAPTALVGYLEMPAFTPDADEAQRNIRAWATAELARACR